MTGFVPMGPPGAGKSFIAKALRDSGIALSALISQRT
jgi:adenylate kinase family enzyme